MKHAQFCSRISGPVSVQQTDRQNKHVGDHQKIQQSAITFMSCNIVNLAGAGGSQNWHSMHPRAMDILTSTANRAMNQPRSPLHGFHSKIKPVSQKLCSQKPHPPTPSWKPFSLALRKDTEFCRGVRGQFVQPKDFPSLIKSLMSLKWVCSGPGIQCRITIPRKYGKSAISGDPVKLPEAAALSS